MSNSDDKFKNIFLKKMQKFEEELAAARKVSSERQLVVTKVCVIVLLVSCCFYEGKEVRQLIFNTHLICAAVQILSSTSGLQWEGQECWKWNQGYFPKTCFLYGKKFLWDIIALYIFSNVLIKLAAGWHFQILTNNFHAVVHADLTCTLFPHDRLS